MANLSPTSLLTQRREELAAIQPTRRNWTEVETWHSRTKPIIATHFKEHLADFERLIKPKWVALPFVVGPNGTGNADAVGRIMDAGNERVAAESTKRLLQFVDAILELQRVGPTELSESPHHPRGTQVFLVHGHDTGARESVARFVERLGLTVSILREGPKRGRTIIEKFEEVAADAGFAVVLLTGDDRGGTKDADSASQRLRARQNVVLELGFFLGKIGRDKVCVLYETGVEIPSDYDGVWFHELDTHGAWRTYLATELRAAGFEFDAAKLLY